MIMSRLYLAEQQKAKQHNQAVLTTIIVATISYGACRAFKGIQVSWQRMYMAETLATRLRLAPRAKGYTTPHLAVFVKLTSLLHHTLWILYVSHNMYFATR